MGDATEFKERLRDALGARENWLNRTELPKLKEEFRVFYTLVYSLYDIFLRKGYITDDPYRNEPKTGDISVPDKGFSQEGNRRDQLGQRLSNLSKEIDYLVNFYQFTVDNFTQEKIKTMLALVGYIDWVQLAPAAGPVTKALGDIVAEARRSAGDTVSFAALNETMVNLGKSSMMIANYLKVVSDFNREAYKCELREYGMTGSSPEDMQISAIKKNFLAKRPGVPFYQELAEEVLKEDCSPQSDALQEKTLKKLAVAGEKTRVAKQTIDYRSVLVEGLNIIGAVSTTLADVIDKMDGNHNLLENRKKSFGEKLARLIAQMMHREADRVLYSLEYADPATGAIVREKIDFVAFTSELSKRYKILAALAPKGSAEKKLAVMAEAQLTDLLQRCIRDISKLHKTLSGLDDFFKENVQDTDRSKIRGVKPELSTMKNAVTKANLKLYDYSAHKEEEEQFKKLGVTVHVR